jgi:hypothetical protein
VTCPAHSQGCRVITTATIVLGQTGETIGLKRVSAKLRGGRTGRFAFVATPSERARLRSYISHHGRAHLSVTLRFAVRDGNGTIGTQTFSNASSRVFDLTRL